MSLSSTKSHIQSPFDAPEAASQKVLRWTYHPWRDEPWFFGVVVGLLVAALVLVTLVTGKVYLGVLAVLAGGLICARVFLPVAYELEAEGLRQTILGRRRMIRWKAIAEARSLDDGLLLLPRGNQRWLGRLRGIYIPCDESMDAVRSCIETHAPWVVSWQDEFTVTDEPTSVPD